MLQTQRQQGLGKPILSGAMRGNRFVAVKNRVHYSPKWKTFHDFLFDYLRTALGTEWGNAEISRPEAERHPVVKWYQSVCYYQRTFVKQSGVVASAPMTGVVAAYMNLAYDLYAIDHNAELQEKLLARVRNHEKFSGARYELFVAAKFVRAGFQVEFENEDDRSTTHCEFTATNGPTDRECQVEAKRREGSKMRIGHLFNDALSKAALHPRVIFIDCNTLDLTRTTLERFMRRLMLFVDKPLNGMARPAAYVILTNSPWEPIQNRPHPPDWPWPPVSRYPTFCQKVH